MTEIPQPYNICNNNNWGEVFKYFKVILRDDEATISYCLSSLQIERYTLIILL